MEIEVKVTATTEVDVDVDAPPYRFVFSDDPDLERIDNKKPGTGLPESPQNRLAGTHSGFATTLRVADANDMFFPEGSMLFQYEGTYLAEVIDVVDLGGFGQSRVGSRRLDEGQNGLVNSHLPIASMRFSLEPPWLGVRPPP
jgi:hypothetical protein